ncbi:MAG TPA: AMP-binding protein [Myxococcales bacterium]|jgi:phenylacetate-CoA ligase
MDLDAARKLFPLVSEAGLRGLERIRQHACAPKWTHEIGDHVIAGDLEAVERFRREQAEPRPFARRGPPEELLAKLAALRERVPLWEERVPQGFDFPRDWGYLPTMTREDLASRVEKCLPLDEPRDRLIVYETSGTTGHAVRVPHHPRAVALLHVLAETALGWHGKKVREGAGEVSCLNLRAQASVWVYASIFSVWREAGFARINLNPHAWSGGVEDCRRFVEEMNPGFLSGDPGSFSEMLRLEVPARPSVLLSTAVALTRPLAQALEAKYGCPVLDWYSTTETGPVACSKPGAEGLALLASDLYVEIVDEEGLPVPEGARGEIVVSGGRNPFLPLLRYRTGDFARMVWGADGPRIVELEGRGSVVFRATDGSPVNPVDVGRALRQNFAVVQHEFVQRADGSCEAKLRPAWGSPINPDQVVAELRGLFGKDAMISASLDEALGVERKAIPYRSELV